MVALCDTLKLTHTHCTVYPVRVKYLAKVTFNIYSSIKGEITNNWCQARPKMISEKKKKYQVMGSQMTAPKNKIKMFGSQQNICHIIFI